MDKIIILKYDVSVAIENNTYYYEPKPYYKYRK